MFVSERALDPPRDDVYKLAIILYSYHSCLVAIPCDTVVSHNGMDSCLGLSSYV